MGQCAAINLLPELAAAVAILLFFRPSRLGGEGNPYLGWAHFDCQANGLDRGAGKRRYGPLECTAALDPIPARRAAISDRRHRGGVPADGRRLNRPRAACLSPPIDHLILSWPERPAVRSSECGGQAG